MELKVYIERMPEDVSAGCAGRWPHAHAPVNQIIFKHHVRQYEAAEL